MVIYKQSKYKFIGREYELDLINKIKQSNSANILIVYGRRRIGKTALIEHAFPKNVIKFEGLEFGGKPEQINNCLRVIAAYFQAPEILIFKSENWVDFFELLHSYLLKKSATIYFEELQWLANYQDEFISALKYVWDNKFSKINKQIIILCGSSPSFMINKVVLSKSLYNRSQFETHLKGFSLSETKNFLGVSNSEALDAYLLVGGVPEYLKALKDQESVLLAFAKNSFLPSAKFVKEYEKIFISSMSENIYYKAIIELLSNRNFFTRNEIAKKLKITSGGGLTNLLTDLKLCSLIEETDSIVFPKISKGGQRYAISDEFLNSYYQLIQNNLKDIEKGKFKNSPIKAINTDALNKIKGFAFERYIRKIDYQIASILGFADVSYSSGQFYKKEEDKNFQIDLLFNRKDKVLTICEIKYRQGLIDKSIISEVDLKVENLKKLVSKSYTIQKVLICSSSPSPSLIQANYFDRVVTLDDIIR